MSNALHTPGAAGAPGPVSAAEARLDDAGLIAVHGPSLITPRTGVMWGPGSTTLITGTGSTAPMQVAIAAHHWVTSRQAADGVYRGAAEAVKLVNIGAAPASGTRVDTVWVKQNDGQSTISPDGTTEPVYGVTPGTPSKQPIPVGAEELGTVSVSAGATATNGAGVVIANTARQTVARGVDIPVRSQAERDALATYPLMAVRRLDTGRIEMRNAADSGWVTVYDPNPPAPPAAPGCELTRDTNQSLTTGGWVNIAWTVENADPRNMHAANSNRVVVPETRWYTITASLRFGGNTTGRRGVRIVKNDDSPAAPSIREVILPAVTNTGVAVAGGAFLAAGEWVAVQGFQESGATQDIAGASCHMAVVPGALT